MIVVLDVVVRVGCHSEVTEVVDELAQIAPAVAVRSDLAHCEVSAAKRNALGVDPDEDLGHCLDVEIVGESDDADLRVLDPTEVRQVGFEDLRIDVRIPLEVLAGIRTVGTRS